MFIPVVYEQNRQLSHKGRMHLDSYNVMWTLNKPCHAFRPRLEGGDNRRRVHGSEWPASEEREPTRERGGQHIIRPSQSSRQVRSKTRAGTEDRDQDWTAHRFVRAVLSQLIG